MLLNNILREKQVPIGTQKMCVNRRKCCGPQQNIALVSEVFNINLVQND